VQLTISVPWLTQTRRLAIAVGAMLILLALVNPATAAGPPQGLEVTVTNDATQPVPVTGSIGADVTGSVAASQEGEWTVGITGTPSVQVANDAAAPVPITGMVSVAPSVPERVRIVDSGGTGGKTGNSCEYTVPAGKQLVVETVSLTTVGAPATASDTWAAFLVVETASIIGVHVIPMALIDIHPGGVRWAGNFTGMSLADAGREVRVNMVGGSDISFNFQCVIVGFLEPVI
jgi:hypothetical protein